MSEAGKGGQVAVLYGGLSVEREVSLVSGEAVARALAEAGYRVELIDAGRDLAARLAETRPEVVFNALHGRYGEDGAVQGLLEWLGLPYTHSGPRASANAMHKPTALALFRAAGLRCPEGVVATLDDVLAGRVMEPPLVVKPAGEGSSVGVHVLLDGDAAPLRQRNDWDVLNTQELLVEKYVAGRELTVTVFNDKALGVTEIRAQDGFYDYRAKYTEAVAEHLLPAPLPEAVYQAALSVAERAHAALGCRDISRADFRYDDSGSPDGLYLLEVNTQPGFTPLSLAPEQANHAGLSFARMVVELVEAARARGRGGKASCG